MIENLIGERDARNIYSLLQEVCGAPDSLLDNFVHCQSEGCREYRFQGTLGFGGKFWNYDRRWYVNYYPENKTPERDAAVAAVNEKLAALKADRK